MIQGEVRSRRGPDPCLTKRTAERNLGFTLEAVRSHCRATGPAARWPDLRFGKMASCGLDQRTVLNRCNGVVEGCWSSAGRIRWCLAPGHPGKGVAEGEK